MAVTTLGERLERVDELAPQILAGGDEAQQLRRLPDDVVSTLVDHGFFRFALRAASSGRCQVPNKGSRWPVRRDIGSGFHGV